MVQRPLHSLHAILLAGTVPLFLGALLSDFAYSSSYEIQWKHFASWLLVGGLFVAFKNGRSVGEPVDFVTGFQTDGNTYGRPVGVTVDPRGALIVADDLSNTVWRVTPTVETAVSTPAAEESR